MSEWEDATSPAGQLAYQCARAGIAYAREVKFHASRKWRFDFVFPNPGVKLALEINGGLFVGGRHTQGAALLKEYDKLSEAAIAGYRVLFVTPQDVTSGRALALIRRALG